MPEIPARIGLIAGQGDFPLLIARAAGSSGVEVYTFALTGFAPPEIEQECDRTFWVELGQLSRAIELMRQNGIRDIIMAGRVPHSSIFQYRYFDMRAVKLLAKAVNKKADALLQAVVDEFASDGILVMDSSHFLKSLMPEPGLLTADRPISESEQCDMDFGYPLAKEIAGLDIGQTIVVKEKMVIAVEGAEGTDACIRRAGELAGPGCVVIKVSKPKQDLRFDIPVIGPGTIQSMATAQAKALAISAGESLLFHKEEVLRLSKGANIGIIALPALVNSASGEK